jgi:hypothetical protein
MKRCLFAGLALIFVIGLQSQPARAQANTWNTPNSFWIGVGAGTGVASYLMTKKHGNPPVRHVSYGTAYGVTTFGCMVVYPMVATVVLNRQLTPREAYVGMADCVVPIIGGWLVDAALPHDAWTDGLPPTARRR